MDDIRAAIGLVQLGKLETDLQKRAQIRSQYIERLEQVPEVTIPFKNHNHFASNYIFPIVLTNSTAQKRDRVRNDLLQRGIQTSVHYPAIHQFSIYKKFTKYLPRTSYVSDNELTLPMYAKLSEDDINRITDSLKVSMIIPQ